MVIEAAVVRFHGVPKQKSSTEALKLRFDNCVFGAVLKAAKCRAHLS